VPAQLLDEIPDAADAELAEVGQILPDLRGIQMELLRERLRGNRAHAGRIQRAQAAQVHRQAMGRQFRYRLGQYAHAGFRHELVLPGHKQIM